MTRPARASADRRAGPTAVNPFQIDVDESVLTDLRCRLARVRLPRDLDNEDWRYGTNTSYLRDLIAYWRDGYDWRAQERELNDLPNFRTKVDGIPIHFVHVRGVGPDPAPLLLSHGWPWTYWDYRHVIGPLTNPAAHGGDPADAFDVVVPSLPGFGFSTPLPRSGVSWITTADIWLELMRDRLGYDRFFAAGADWGVGITTQLGHKYPEHVRGIHVCGGRTLAIWNTPRPWDLLGQFPLGEDKGERARVLAWQRRLASHVSVHVLDPQTLAHGLHDSPAGLCSWLVERRRAWSDCGGDVESRFPKDDLLTLVMLYWVTDSFVSSARYYAEAATHPWTPARPGTPEVTVPSSVSVFRPDVVRIPTDESLRAVYNLTQFRVHERGGHFAAAEEPETIVTDLRDGFREQR